MSLGQQLPPDIIDTYSRYKSGTGIIVEWLVEHGSCSQDSKTTTRSIKDLWRLAANVHAKAKEVPLHIKSIFHHTIGARTRLTTFFKSKRHGAASNRRDASHEYFTSSLQRIYDVLCGQTEPTTPVAIGFPQNEAAGGKIVTDNPFELLGSCPQDDETEFSESVNKVESDGCHGLPKDTPPSAGSFLLDGDELGVALEVLRSLEELGRLYTAIEKSWERVANGSLPLLVATLLTNSGFKAVKLIEERVASALGSSSPDVLLVKYEEIQENLGFQPDEQNISAAAEDCPRRMIRRLQEAWAVLLKFREKSKHVSNEGNPDGLRCSQRLQKPCDYFLQPDMESHQSDHDSLDMLAQNIHDCWLWEADGVMNDIKQFMVFGKTETGLSCAFGLRMLQTTFRKFIWPTQIENKPNKRNCRVEFLQYLADIRVNINEILKNPTMGCSCQDGLPYHLRSVEVGLELLLGHKEFDLVHQAPWYAGSLMIERFNTIFWYGLRLCSFNQYVGIILHTYHATRLCSDFPEIPLLENLCYVLREIFFLGERPTRNLQSCFRRFVGQRLQFNQCCRSYQWANPQTRAKPPATNGSLVLRKELNDDRFSETLFPFFYIQRTNYLLEREDIWKDLATINSTKKASKRRSSKQKEQLDDLLRGKTTGKNLETADLSVTTPPSSHPALEMIEKLVIPDIEGTFPVAKINFFAVYLACARIFSIIGEQTHPQHKNADCSCFLDVTLIEADEIINQRMQQGRSKGKLRKKREYLGGDVGKLFADTVVEVLGEAKLEDFLWQL